MVDIHGKSKGKSFFCTLLCIREFLRLNPREFVILEICPGKSLPLTEIQTNWLKEVIVYLFSPRLVTRADCLDWFQLESVTLQKVWDHNKQVLGLFPTSLTRDGFVSCQRLTKQSQKQVNYQISRVSADSVGLLPKDEFVLDISVKAADKKTFFAQNMKKVSIKHASKFVENQFLIKARMDRKQVLHSVKHFFKNAIKGSKELCHDLLKKDELVQLVLEFCQNGGLNIGRSS